MALTDTQLRDVLRRYETTDGLPIIDLPAGIFDIRNTLDLVAHGVGFRGAGRERTILRNVNESGAPMFRVTNVGDVSVDNFTLQSLTLESEAGAGHVVEFDLGSGAGHWLWRDTNVFQRNPNASIMRASFLKIGDSPKGDGGMYDNSFVDQFWEHGVRNSAPPTVPALDIDGDFQAFNITRFARFRVDTNEGTAPFVRLVNNAPEAVRFWYHAHFSDWTCETVRSGVFDLGGLHKCILENIAVLDTQFMDNHVIQLREGTVQGCEQCVIRDYVRPGTSDVLKGVAGTSKAAGYTSSGSTITATYSVAPGYAVGQPLFIEGAGITSQHVTVATVAGTVVTFTATGSLPASGSLTSYESVCDIKLGSSSSWTALTNIGGNSDDGAVLVDCNERPVEIHGKTQAVSYFRVNAGATVVTGTGFVDQAVVEADIVRCNELAERSVGAGFVLPGGATLKGYRKASATLDFPSVAANGGIQELTISVPGIGANDRVIAEPGSAGALEAGLIPWAYCSAVDTVTIRLTNATAAPIDPASRTWNVTVFS